MIPIIEYNLFQPLDGIIYTLEILLKRVTDRELYLYIGFYTFFQLNKKSKYKTHHSRKGYEFATLPRGFLVHKPINGLHLQGRILLSDSMRSSYWLTWEAAHRGCEIFRLQGKEWSFFHIINFRAPVLIVIKNTFTRMQPITCLTTHLFGYKFWKQWALWRNVVCLSNIRDMHICVFIGIYETKTSARLLILQ